jgi:hypothetical protein
MSKKRQIRLYWIFWFNAECLQTTDVNTWWVWEDTDVKCDHWLKALGDKIWNFGWTKMASNTSLGKLTKLPQREEEQSADYQPLDKSSSNTLKVSFFFQFLLIFHFGHVSECFTISCLQGTANTSHIFLSFPNIHASQYSYRFVLCRSCK